MKSDESPAPAGAATRAMSRDEDSDSTNFARWTEAAENDDLWRDLCETLGRDEMNRMGATWLMRLETHRGQLATALEDYRVQSPEARAAIANRGAYLTERFSAHLKRTA